MGAGAQAGTRAEVVVALLTPYRADGAVDFDVVRAHVDALVAAGVEGIMPAGTTGEGPLLDDDEIVALARAVADAATGRARVLVHVGRPSTRATIALAVRAFEAGADAVSAVVPYYYAVDEERQLAHFGALLEALDGRGPLYAYTIPGRTGNELPATAVAELGRAGLAGVKDSSKSLERHREYLATGVPVLMGSDGLLRDAFEAGAAGCVSAIANVRPELPVRLADAVAAGRGDEAAVLQDEISTLRAELARERPLVALKRLAAARVPDYSPALRMPLG